MGGLLVGGDFTTVTSKKSSPVVMSPVTTLYPWLLSIGNSAVSDAQVPAGQSAGTVAFDDGEWCGVEVVRPSSFSGSHPQSACRDTTGPS